jgi:hypothetical protein
MQIIEVNRYSKVSDIYDIIIKREEVYIKLNMA